MAEKKKILYIVEAMGGGVFTYIVDVDKLADVLGSYDEIVAKMPGGQESNNAKFCEGFEKIVEGMFH